ncbi:uncharacterized protein HaLaN_05000 [Haematococcus lacustris]|uniref:Uncharacterized protein n=1 Tax=Haematococcus lacustris TaxID=44745 RepID=A0A699YJV9_HAELA|nr:uncharacterized protein HaLaN_05000 [Haematococcus lacustris]
MAPAAAPCLTQAVSCALRPSKAFGPVALRKPFFLASVLVVNETTGAQGLFLVNRLLLPEEYVLLGAQDSLPVDYEVEVATSNRSGAGTTARPFVEIMGMQGTTGRVDLESGGSLRAGAEAEAQAAGKGSLPNLCSGAEACRCRGWDRGSAAKHIFHGPRLLCDGPRLRVGADARGHSRVRLRVLRRTVTPMPRCNCMQATCGRVTGWWSRQVFAPWTEGRGHYAAAGGWSRRLWANASGASALFPCNQWLSAGKGDKKTSRVLDAEEVSPAQPPTASVLPLPALGQPVVHLVALVALLRGQGHAEPRGTSLGGLRTLSYAL